MDKQTLDFRFGRDPGVWAYGYTAGYRVAKQGLHGIFIRNLFVEVAVFHSEAIPIQPLASNISNSDLLQPVYNELQTDRFMARFICRTAGLK